ncbi:DnaD domain protein, partial [Abiotrophia defectiva]|uniref:DnaD domain protein n=1 Tax=Abiotrophia defectiva TaxID=46125 RepID=UPI0028D6D7AD
TSLSQGTQLSSLSQGTQLSSLSQGTQLLSGSQWTHGASRSLSTSDLHNQDPNQKDNQIHKENQSHNHKQNQNHNSAPKLDPDSEGKSLASNLMNDPDLTKGRDSESTLGLPMNSLDGATSSQPFGQAISLPDQSFSQTLARAQSLTSKPGQSQAGLSQQTMDQFVRVERDMAKLRPFYERYFGPMTGAESLQFRNWLDKIGYWPVIEAIEQAHRRQAKKPFAYISTICQQASKT